MTKKKYTNDFLMLSLQTTDFFVNTFKLNYSVRSRSVISVISLFFFFFFFFFVKCSRNTVHGLIIWNKLLNNYDVKVNGKHFCHLQYSNPFQWDLTLKGKKFYSRSNFFP